jgi:hypothetical protein
MVGYKVTGRYLCKAYVLGAVSKNVETLVTQKGS